MRWRQYREFLANSEAQLGKNAYEFAIAPWHHDADDFRSLHNANVSHVDFSILPREKRYATITFLNRWETHHIVLSYDKVCAFEMTFDRKSEGSGKEDLLIDEIGLSPQSLRTHTLVFASGHVWTIEFEDLRIAFEPVIA